jgi:hypothetical protein
MVELDICRQTWDTHLKKKREMSEGNNGKRLLVLQSKKVKPHLEPHGLIQEGQETSTYQYKMSLQQGTKWPKLRPPSSKEADGP